MKFTTYLKAEVDADSRKSELDMQTLRIGRRAAGWTGIKHGDTVVRNPW